MAMSWIWGGMVILSLLFGAATGRIDAVSEAALSGAQNAVELSLSMAGVLCLWSGIMEIMRVCGLTDGLARAFRPLMRRLLPEASRDSETLAAVSANVSANLLGLGNAATPLGIQAARRMARGCGGVASDELCRLVVLNTASI
ncbi:MAG: spore maturation protein A, partial [Clostridiales bacterium]|nr:spore maturation protein A [Clostridiales bacterium]